MSRLQKDQDGVESMDSVKPNFSGAHEELLEDAVSIEDIDEVLEKLATAGISGTTRAGPDGERLGDQPGFQVGFFTTSGNPAREPEREHREERDSEHRRFQRVELGFAVVARDGVGFGWCEAGVQQ